ncbi:hypothetical protein [Rhizobium sp. 11_C7_N12_5]|uniref:hypothetical protein n=1 Tax=Rhizobium sp. 11_C7_N12_5 TaxID=3240770 RepID=UPI003F22E5D2
MTNGLGLPLPPQGLTALTVTLAWIGSSEQFDGHFAPALQMVEASGTSDTLAEHLAAAGLFEWRDLIVSAEDPGQSSPPDQRLAWLMANAAVEVAVALDAPGLFRAVAQLREMGGIDDTELAAEVCRRLAGASGELLLARLRERLQQLWDSPFNERIRRYAEATVEFPLTTRDLWPRRDGMPLGDRWAHRVAATLWPREYMATLASFPGPFQHRFGDPLWPPDPDLAASLIRTSPAVYTDDGIPNGPVVVFVLLDAVEAYLQSTAAHDKRAAEVGLGRIVDAVLSRNDGNWIGRAWIQQIIWQDTPRRAGRAEADVAAQRALRDFLLDLLSSQITPLDDGAAFDWVRSEEPLWAVDRVLAEVSILDAHDNPVAAAEVLASSVRQGLVTATGRPSGIVTHSPEATIVSRPLSKLKDLTLWFTTLWRDTYEVRESLSYPTQRNLDNPAYPALAWGLVGLNSSANSNVDPARLWQAVADAVFETQQIDPNASLFNGAMPPITRVTVQLGAALADCGVVPIGDLAQFMADQLDPTIEHARLWQMAREAASDAVTLAVGRLVGAPLLRQALETALSETQPSWDTVLDEVVRADLADFARRL